VLARGELTAIRRGWSPKVRHSRGEGNPVFYIVIPSNVEESFFEDVPPSVDQLCRISSGGRGTFVSAKVPKTICPCRPLYFLRFAEKSLTLIQLAGQTEKRGQQPRL
jgi:hypothetical protein